MEFFHEDLFVEKGDSMTFEWPGVDSPFLSQLIAAAIEVAVGFFIASIVRHWILHFKKKTSQENYGILTFSSSAASILIRFLSLVIAMAQLGVNTDMIVGAFSAIGLGISFALRDSMANVAGGVQILVTHSFRVGDYIQYEDFEGTVQEIEIMYTTLKTPNNQEIIIPNNKLVTDAVINYSKFPHRRIRIDLEVSMDGNYQDFQKAALLLIDKETDILPDPAPSAKITAFNPSGNAVTLSLFCYCDVSKYWDIYYDLNQKLQELRYEMNIMQPVSAVAYFNGESILQDSADKKAKLS